MNNNITPLVSVIIPLYNAEKYIGACLQSILEQTFKNFEVIVVDDCSTDDSVKIVDGFIPKFEGRLKLSRLEKNSGGPAIPQNKGISIASGKYVFVMDNDDLISNVALETLYNYAEKFNADVIYMDSYISFNARNKNSDPSPKNFSVVNGKANITKPMLIEENIPARLQRCAKFFYSWPAWKKFVKREFLIKNNIAFPELKSASDVGWTIELIYSANRLLCINEPLYIWRVHSDSLTHKRRTVEEWVDYWLEFFVKGINFFDNWTSKQKFLQDNSQFKWFMFDLIKIVYLSNMQAVLSKLRTDEYCDIVEDRLKSNFGENAAITAYLFATSTMQN